MSSERMPQPEGIAKVKQPVMESNSIDKSKTDVDSNAESKVSPLENDKNIGKVEDKEKQDPSQSDKEAAASLGLHRVTEKMLNTIKASKDIERNQRNVISKLALKSNGEEEEEEEEDEEEEDEEGDDEGNNDEDGNSENNGEEQEANNNLEATKKRAIELKASQGTSLKRKKIPPPLDLSSCSSGSTTAPNSNLNTAVQERHTRYGRVESAPPNVPRFPRSTSTARPIGKPRVQYLGKSRPIQSISQQQQLKQGGYKLKTPFVPRMPLAPWQQQPQYYPYPYAPATAAAVPPPMLQPPIPQNYQRPYNYPIPPRSAIPLQIPYYQDYQSYTPYTTTQRKRPQHSGTATTAVNDSEDLRNKESDANQQNPNQPQRNQETEYSQLTVDDDTTFSSSSSSIDEPMHGEIRIQRNVFSFEFPGNSPAIDKKMFMSICDKVWDESRELTRV